MVKEYLNYIKDVRNLSENTITGYEKDIRTFVHWAQAQRLSWRALQRNDIDRWLADQAREGIAPATRNRRLSALRSMLAWAQHHGYPIENPARFCQRAQGVDAVPYALDVKNIDAWLQREQTSTLDIVLTAAVAIMLETGIRLSELLNIEQADINKEQHTIKVLGKGARERVVYFGQRTEKAIAPLLAPVPGKIFPGWWPQTWRREIKKSMRPYVGDVHPHQLRHTFATAMLNNGADIATISTILGHKRIETTQRYARVSNPHAQQVYQQTIF